MQAGEHFIKQFVPEHYDLFLDLSRETKSFWWREIRSLCA